MNSTVQEAIAYYLYTQLQGESFNFFGFGQDVPYSEAEFAISNRVQDRYFKVNSLASGLIDYLREQDIMLNKLIHHD